MILIGAMSGTSTDAVDAAALHWAPREGQPPQLKYLGVVSCPFTPTLKEKLLALQQVPMASSRGDALLAMLQTRHDLSLFYAEVVQGLLSELGLAPQDVSAVGAHGQTLRHRPELGITYQMLDGALLAARLQIPVVCDLRASDVAIGGQGAPLVPGFHQAWLEPQGLCHRTAVLNLGGFSNLTVFPHAGAAPLGGDCGPANCLLDAWVRHVWGLEFDEDGAIAAGGMVDETLLDALLSHPFFSKPWPKSTGRDDFHLSALLDLLQRLPNKPSPEDVQATLLEMAVKAVCDCLPSGLDRLFVCGGGALNPTMMAAFQRALPLMDVRSTADLGMPPMSMEASAFAWLAGCRLHTLQGNCPSVTGAGKAAVLGALYLP